MHINNYKHLVYPLLFLSCEIIFSQTIQELEQLKRDYEQLNKNKQELQLPRNNINNLNQDIAVPAKTEISPYTIPEEEGENLINRHFGYSFFTQRDTVAFWENLPTPSNYLLGPGDELIVSLWGQTQLRQNYIISREGKIYDDKVGLLNLMGKTINEARDYMKSQFGRVYATLNGSTPTTFIDVSLGELRSINVNFVGNVRYPGVYPIHPFSNLITGLIQSGGVDTTGSLRQIQIKRDGETYNTVDLYNFFISGKLPGNIQLRDKDIVVVPPRSSIIKIDSAVVNPGIYESKDGETVHNLIDFAGGALFNSSGNIGIRKILPINERINGSYKFYYVDLEDTKLILANPGDEITVRFLFPEDHEVEILGQVKAPGVYHFNEGMTFRDLIDLSGGFLDSTFWKSVYHESAEIIRRDPSSRYEKVIKVNLTKIYDNNFDTKIYLQNLDRIIIHANLNYFEKDPIFIMGEVNIPGSYPIITDNETLASVIDRAGGLTSKALNNGISIYRNETYFNFKKNIEYVDVGQMTSQDQEDLKLSAISSSSDNSRVRVAWRNENITLMPGDSIVVKESTGTVFVDGEVYNPGLIEFRNNQSLKNYIYAAGGVTDRGSSKNIIVIYANGVVSPKRWYSSPKVEDGATIIVNQKEISEPFNITQFVTNWTSILSSMVTVIVLSRQIGNN